MTQLTFSLSPSGTKQAAVIARLLVATEMEPVSLLDFDRRVYGTSVDRFIRFARLGTARADHEIEASKARTED